MKIYENKENSIKYDAFENRAKIMPTASEKPNSVAMLCFRKENRGFFENIYYGLIKHFAWNWVQVNSSHSDVIQFVNKASVSNRLGIKSEDIHKLNQTENGLYGEMIKRNVTLLQRQKLKTYEISNDKVLSLLKTNVDIPAKKSETEIITHGVDIYFNPKDKSVEIHTPYSKSKTKDFHTLVEGSFLVKGALYEENGKFYLTNLGKVFEPHSTKDYEESDTIREEVRNILKSK